MRTSSSVGWPFGCPVTSVSWIASVWTDSPARLLVVLLRTARFAIRCLPPAHVRALAAPSSSVAARKIPSIRRVSIIEPRLGRVRVAALLPESAAVVSEKLDLADPLRSLPRIELRGDHPAGAAVLGRQRLALPSVHEQHIVLGRARQRQVRRVRDVGSRREIVASNQDVSRVRLRHGELGDGLEADPFPVIVEPAPRRHAVEVADVLDLGERQEILPPQRQRMFDEPGYLELPIRQGNLGLLTKVQNGPVLYFVLANRQPRHPVTVG